MNSDCSVTVQWFSEKIYRHKHTDTDKQSNRGIGPHGSTSLFEVIGETVDKVRNCPEAGENREALGKKQGLGVGVGGCFS